MYATVAQAKEYIEQYYSSTDPLRKAWEELSEQDQLVLLNRAEQSIDGLPLRGCPLVKGKAFPRTPFQETSLQSAKIATIELALSSLNVEASERLSLRRQGVKSYKIGDLSETFVDSNAGVSTAVYALLIVSPYLADWLGGGYRICPTQTRK